MTSILFLIETIYRYQFGCSYLTNKKTFSEFFTAFLKSGLNFKHFVKEDDPQRFCLFEITESEKVVRKMSEKYRFRRPLNMEHGKRAQAMLKSASQHLYQLP